MRIVKFLSLDMRGANAMGIRISVDHDWDRLHGFTRRVALFAFTR
jgi:hypothetical protein